MRPVIILSRLTKLSRRRRPVWEQDKLLSEVKSDRCCQFTCHDYDDLMENVNQENLFSIFSRSIWCLFRCD